MSRPAFLSGWANWRTWTARNSSDLGLRVFVGHKVAFVSSTDFSRSALEALPERAIAMAWLAPDDKFAGLAPANRLAKDIPTLDIEIAMSLPLNAWSSARVAPRALPSPFRGVTNSEGGGASFGRTMVTLATSEGFLGGYTGTSHSVSVSVIAGEGTAMEADNAYASARHGGDLESAEAVGERAGERAVKRLGPRKVKTQAVPVFYDPRVASSLLGHFIGAISGSAIARGVSFLKDRMNEDVFSSGVTIVDDPHRKRGRRSKPFDGEGVANARHVLIDKGRLTTWLLDSASARQLNLATTGHAARGTGGPPHPAPTNLYMELGGATPDALMKHVREGFYVTDLIGMGGTASPAIIAAAPLASGSRTARVSYPVSEVTIAGNLKDMYRNLTPANDLVFRYGFDAPTIRVDGMTIAGA